MRGLHTPMSSFSSHRRKNSGELDVFEATRYFSGGTDMAPAPRRAVRGDYKMSLDMPIDAKVPTRVDLLNNHIKGKVIKCNKQPSSPGGRLATFINSLFQHYSASKKKKKASKKGEEEISGRRRRMSTTTCYYSSSRTGNSTSGFRTPSVLHSISKKTEDHYQGFSNNYNKDHEDHNWGGDHELRVRMRLGDELMSLKNTIKGQDINIKGFRHEDDADDDEGGVSDSSSDLFELKNYHGFGDEMSSGLPVYGSTDMGVIRRGAGSLASTVAY